MGFFLFFFIFLSFFSLFSFVFPLDDVEALDNYLRGLRGFFFGFFFFFFCLETTNRESRMRRHGPGSIFMVVCDNVVRAEGVSAFSLNALSPGFATRNLK